MTVTAMTATEVARALQITPATAYEMARRGDLPCIRLGRVVRFPRLAIEAMAAGVAGPEPDRPEAA